MNNAINILRQGLSSSSKEMKEEGINISQIGNSDFYKHRVNTQPLIIDGDIVGVSTSVKNTNDSLLHSSLLSQYSLSSFWKNSHIYSDKLFKEFTDDTSSFQNSISKLFFIQQNHILGNTNKVDEIGKEVCEKINNFLHDIELCNKEINKEVHFSLKEVNNLLKKWQEACIENSKNPTIDNLSLKEKIEKELAVFIPVNIEENMITSYEKILVDKHQCFSFSFQDNCIFFNNQPITVYGGKIGAALVNIKEGEEVKDKVLDIAHNILSSTKENEINPFSLSSSKMIFDSEKFQKINNDQVKEIVDKCEDLGQEINRNCLIYKSKNDYHENLLDKKEEEIFKVINTNYEESINLLQNALQKQEACCIALKFLMESEKSFLDIFR